MQLALRNAQDMSHVPGEVTGAALKYPLGKVVGILKRNWKAAGYCGSIRPPKSATPTGHTVCVQFRPIDRRLPRIYIRTAQQQELIGQRIVVRMDAWAADAALPFGHYVRKIGAIGDKDTETEVLLHENDIQAGPFTPAVHACLPPLPWSVPASALQDSHRQDLRHLCICSVDPSECKDIDDALHIQSLPNGNYEIGVHIADVTHFVLPGDQTVSCSLMYAVKCRDGFG